MTDLARNSRNFSPSHYGDGHEMKIIETEMESKASSDPLFTGAAWNGHHSCLLADKNCHTKLALLSLLPAGLSPFIPVFLISDTAYHSLHPSSGSLVETHFERSRLSNPTESATETAESENRPWRCGSLRGEDTGCGVFTGRMRGNHVLAERPHKSPNKSIERQGGDAAAARSDYFIDWKLAGEGSGII
jgi:hypothetical protein